MGKNSNRYMTSLQTFGRSFKSQWEKLKPSSCSFLDYEEVFQIPMGKTQTRIDLWRSYRRHLVSNPNGKVQNQGASVFWHTINEFQIPKGKSRTEYAEKDIPFVSNPNGKKFESIQ